MNITKLAAVIALFVSAPVFAQEVTINVRDVGGNAVAGAAVTFTQNGAAQSGTSDGNGNAAFTAAAGAAFQTSITVAGYRGLNFSRNFPAAASWALAQIVLQRRASGTSYVAQYRTGVTGPNEDPSQDSARFNFVVAYYRDGSAIAGATITLTNNTDGSVRTLTTDGNGAATCLVREQSSISVQIDAAGYASYTTSLSPGLNATSRRVAIRLRKTV